ncbi:MAG: lipopolysaccharide heptosyltransferase family protein [Rhodanobacter sp.]|nr:lipopolysaccharide heptosyltransferase family protein [Rhodanobacter sp.]
MADSPRSPIVVRFGAFGDLVILTPLLHLLHQRFGEPCTLVTSGAWAEPLLGAHPDVRRILRLTSRRRPYLLDPQQWRLTRALRALPDAPVYVGDEYAIDKVRFLLARGGVTPERCVFIGDPPPIADAHWVDRMLRLGMRTPAAFDAHATPWRDVDIAHAPILRIGDADRADCAAWLDALGLAHSPLVLLQPGNKRTLKRGRLGALGDDKTWPVGHWADLCRAIAQHRPDVRIVLCGSPQEQGLLDDIRAATRHANVYVAATDLPPRRLLALQERAHSMISIDTGPAHSAAAMGCPLVVLYGAASPMNWKPRSTSGSAVIALTSPARRVDGISVDTVISAWVSLFSTTG